MKYFCSFLLFIAFSLQSSAQSRFLFGYVFSLEAGTINQYYFGKPEFSPGYTTGLQISYKISEKLRLTSGIQYSDKRFSTKNTFSDPWFMGSPPKGTFNYSFRFIELPLLLSGPTKITSGFSLYMSAGFIPAYLSSAKMPSGADYETKILNRSDLNSALYNKFIVSSYLGIGGLVKLSDDFSLLIQPNFKYSTRINSRTAASGDYQNNFNPYSIGLLCGVDYKFK